MPYYSFYDLYTSSLDWLGLHGRKLYVPDVVVFLHAFSIQSIFDLGQLSLAAIRKKMIKKEVIKRISLSIALLVALLVAPLVSVIAFVHVLYNPHYIVYISATLLFILLFQACWFIAGEILSKPNLFASWRKDD